MECPLLHGNIQKETERETEKSTLHTFIQSYTFISFPENFPPIRLFRIVVYSEL